MQSKNSPCIFKEKTTDKDNDGNKVGSPKA